MTRLITTHGLSAAYNRQIVLRSVDFSKAAGEIVTIANPNGSGKSTLLRLLAWIFPASSGSITRMPGLRIGYVRQVLHIDPTLPMTAPVS